MSQTRQELVAAVIRNHFNWYGDSQPNTLAVEIDEALQHHATVAPLTDDEINHVREIVFPNQKHPDDIDWGLKVVTSSVKVADILRANR